MLKLIKWSDDMIKRFWEFRSKHTTIEYSADHLSNRLLKLVKNDIPNHGRVLDIGFGSGTLLKKLDSIGYECSGIDLSESCGIRASLPESVKLYYGSIFDIRLNNNFNLIFLMDVLEHLPDANVVPRLQHIANLLSDDGVLIITTPSNEDFKNALVYCPTCKSVFHAHQHVHTWDVTKMEQICSDAELDVIMIREIKEHIFIESFARRFIFSIYYYLMKINPKKTMLIVAKRKGETE